MSREEMKALLEAPRTLRHRAPLAVLYGCGVRVAEVAHLKVTDIDTRRHLMWVRQRKGRRDRQMLLSSKLLTRPISAKAVFLACRKAGRKAGLF
jgi:integrase/recombinase XerD